MYNTQFIKLLKSLSKREKTQFQQFLDSPFFNKNKDIQKLGNIVLKSNLDEQNNILQRQLVYRKIYSKKPFNEARFNNLVSDMLALFHQFLAHTQVQQQPIVQQTLLINALQDRDLTTYIPRASKHFQKLLGKHPYRNYEYYLNEYLYYEGLDTAFLERSQHINDPNIQLKSDRLDLYFVANKLRIACDMLSRNTVINANYKCRFLEEIKTFYQQNENTLKQEPSLTNYYRIYQMLNVPDNEQFYADSKASLSTTWHLFPPEEARTQYSFLLNYCVRKINSGKSDFYKEILDVYRFLLEQKIIIRNDTITRWTFTNILTAAVRLKAFDWAEQFILTYDQYLLPSERQNVVTYNLANLYYAQQNYSKALQTLHDVEFNDPSYHTGAKIVQMKCYYDLAETEALFALIDAFKMYILRHKKISTYQKRANKNMMTFVKKIHQLHLAESRLNAFDFEQRWIKLVDRLEQTNPLANKNWVIKILNELKS